MKLVNASRMEQTDPEYPRSPNGCNGSFLFLVRNDAAYSSSPMFHISLRRLRKRSA